jgi:hypothetical protein
MPKGIKFNIVRKLACALPGVKEEGASAAPAFSFVRQLPDIGVKGS